MPFTVRVLTSISGKPVRAGTFDTQDLARWWLLAWMRDGFFPIADVPEIYPALEVFIPRDSVTTAYIVET